MIIRVLSITILMLFTFHCGFGQIKADTKEYRIDSMMSKCLAKDNSDAGMINCLQNAEISWDKELNKSYKLLLNQLDTADQKSLKESQRQWIIYRDKEINFLTALYGKREGSMWNLIIADNRMQITRQRAIELSGYYETISQQ